MGTQRSTNEADYRLYARPKPGESGDWIEVVADGAGQAPRHADGGEFDDSDAPGGDLGDRLLDGAPDDRGPVTRRNRVNPYLCAAWALVALMLFLGITWLAGTWIVDQNLPFDSRWGTVVMNFQATGMFMLPCGLVTAALLLALHAVGWTGPDDGPRAGRQSRHAAGRDS